MGLPKGIIMKTSTRSRILLLSIVAAATVAAVACLLNLDFLEAQRPAEYTAVGAPANATPRPASRIPTSPSAPVSAPQRIAGEVAAKAKAAMGGSSYGYGYGGYGGTVLFESERASIGGIVPDQEYRAYGVPHNTEAYDSLIENPFLLAKGNPLSTFSIDVDTASYANIRRILRQGQTPPAGAARIEEMINYFSYDYPEPEKGQAFSVAVDIASCPWKPERRLTRIGLKGRSIPQEKRPASNLVFLLDVSGSMNQPNKLPLLKDAMSLLAGQLNENDRVSIVVYAGAAGLILPSTPCSDRNVILNALNDLRAGGSTAGGAGIKLAYQIAQDNFIEEGINRVILATDGDFNVGVTNQSELVDLIEDRAKSGVFLTVLGFGMGNYKDSTLEKLADKGNGNYAYIDTLNEAKKNLVEQMSGTLITIAKDVKIQVEFNPALVQAYRLIGYENRMLRAEDFKDDTKDAGEIGAEHTVTALYEVVPAGVEFEAPDVDELKYQKPVELAKTDFGEEIMTVKLRYKKPDGDTSIPLSFPTLDKGLNWKNASDDFKFAAAVASFGMLLRESKHSGLATFDYSLELAEEGIGKDRHGYRKEFLELVQTAKELNGRQVASR